MKTGGLLQALQIPSKGWEKVSTDLLTGLPLTAKQHEGILTPVDTVSKMAHCISTEATVTAEGAVSLLADRRVRYHGLPSAIVSNRDPRFVSGLWKLFRDSKASEHCPVPGIPKQTDRRKGCTERASKYGVPVFNLMNQHGKISCQQLNWRTTARYITASDVSHLKR